MADRITFVTVLILITIGLLASYSLPIYLEVNSELSQFYFVKKFAIFSFIGIIIIYTLSMLNPDIWFRRVWITIFLGSLLAILSMSIFPSIAPPINGARRWIKLIGGIYIAPVEFLKVGFIGFLAWNLPNKALANTNRHKSIKDELIIFAPYFVIIAFIGYFILAFQSDFGQVMVMVMIFGLMWLFIGANSRLFFILILIALIGFIFLLTTGGYRLARFSAWLYSITPSFFNQEDSFKFIDSYRQVYVAIDAIHNGGLFGQTVGSGVFKLGFFSDVQTDFVLAGLAEETGILGIAIITLLFLILIFRFLKIAKHTENIRYSLFSIGVAIMIGGQFLINAFGESGILPIKGLTVPFISYGGSSMIAMSIAIGMVLMVSKRSHL